MALTDNMRLDLPVPSTTPGPGYATQLVTALTAIDAHDHTTDKGVKIPSSALNINADVECNNNDLKEVRSVRMENHAVALGESTDLGCVYEAGGDLYWNSGAGDQVRITSGPALDASSIGAIGGDYGTSTASLYYTAASKTFTFESDTSESAAIDCGPVTIRELAVASAKGITIESPTSLAADYGLELPDELPSVTKVLTLDSAGKIAGGRNVAVGQQVSDSSGAFSTASGTYVNVTNLSVTITTTGRPVMLMLMSAGSPVGYMMTAGDFGYLNLMRDTTQIAELLVESGNPLPFTSVHLDVVAAGSYTYKVQAKTDGTLIGIYAMKLVAFEL